MPPISNPSARKPWRLRWQGLMVLLAALTVWGFADVRQRGYLRPHNPEEHRTDLTVYTESGAAFFDGRSPYEVANPRGWTYLYPPLFALLLAPLHALPMQDQVTVWFFISLLFCWGCYRECRRLVTIVCDEDSRVAAAWAGWFPWLGIAAVATAVLPTLNCLQRGQVGVVKLYLLLLGFRLILGGRGYRAWLTGGIVLALPIVLKIVPLLPVGFLLFLEMINLFRAIRSSRHTPCAVTSRPVGSTWQAGPARAGPRFMASGLGVAAGLVLFVLVVPAVLVGWKANLHHLDTWGRFMLTKANNGGMDPRSGNSHSSRNQSLQNAAYRLGNFAAHLWAGGPDDQEAERSFDAPRMAMDSATADGWLFFARGAMTLALLALAGALMRGDGSRLDLATGFAVSCVAMLVVSPVARGHYFLMLAPAVLMVPLWLDRHGWHRAGMAIMAVPGPLCLLHYALLPAGSGRIGLLGMGTAAWLMAVMVLVARAAWASRREVAGQDPLAESPWQVQGRAA
jgi:hypothetical protein